jgi:hypothetical protein
MEMESVKSKILELHEVWDVLGDGSDSFKYGEIHESFVVDLIANYCVERGYEVDGFPIKKRELAKENNSYNEDYFCEARYIKYLDVLATKYEDVLELMYFYSSTFGWNILMTMKNIKIGSWIISVVMFMRLSFNL